MRASSRSSTKGRRGLTRDAIVQRALEIGDEEGLEAVSVRRVASDLGVTPMALYRHVRDKNDLYNAMLDEVIAGVDLTAGIKPTMPWQQQVRRGLQNAVELLTARPVTLPLQIAYQGPLTPSIARSLEASLGILLQAGFSPRNAVALARMLPVLLAGLLLLYREGPGGSIGPEECDRLRRQAELQLLDLPADEFPMMRRHARLIGETIFPDTDRWLRQAIDLIVDGLETTLNRQTKRAVADRG
ncbi:MAG TPA: TetR/AcrR family transcriptional regulator [Candidatus Dormibacteraeota bacterium]|nr:TetR/AcrR family transcriptional regulator [Candidatus Dormibacteraeota bacterium]